MKNTIVLKPFKVGTKVGWNWMGRVVQGSIKKIYFKPVTKLREGKPFTRNGSSDKPAYLIKSSAGSEILKLHTELHLLKVK